LPVSDFQLVIVGNAVNREKAQIVRRELILDSRIAKSDYQLHAGSAALGGTAEHCSAGRARAPVPTW
jgi:hypothetical protein